MARFILLFLMFCLWNSSLSQSTKGDEIYNRAKADLEKGAIDKSIKGFLNARTVYLTEKNYHRSLVATQNVAMYYQDSGKGSEAEKLILETIAAVPTDELQIHASLQDNLAYTYLYLLDRIEDAVSAYSKSIQLYADAGMSTSTKYAFELVNRAIANISLYRYEPAIADMQKAISIYVKDPETTVEEVADYYRTLASAFLGLDNYDDALKSYQNAFNGVSNTDNKELIATLYNDFGNVYTRQGLYLKALENFQQAQQINESLFGKDAEHYALNLINIGSVNKEMGDYSTAMTVFQEALSIYSRTPPQETSHLIDLLILISSVADNVGKFKEASLLLDEALKLAVKDYGSNSLMEADVYSSMAIAAFNRYGYDQSLTYNFKALGILKAISYPENEFHAMLFTNIGEAYDGLGDLDLALEYKTRALELYKKVNGSEHPSVARVLGNLGLTYEMQEKYDIVIEYLKQSVAIRLKTQNAHHDDVGTDYLNIGLMYMKKNEVASGIRYLEQAREIYDHHVKNVTKAMIYNRLAYGYNILGDEAKTKLAIQKAIVANTHGFDNTTFDVNPAQPDILDYYELNLSYTAKVNVYTRQGTKESLVKGMQLLDACDEILQVKSGEMKNQKDKLELAQLNSFFTEAGMLLADKLYAITRDQSILEKAFYFSERSKANELFADIQLTRAEGVSTVPKKLYEHHSVLKRQLASLNQQLALAHHAKSESLVSKLKAEELTVSKEYELVQNEINRTSPAYSSVTNQRTLPAWSEVCKKLDSKTALVMYTVTDSARYVLVGTANKLEIRPISLSANLDKLIKKYITLIKFRDPYWQETAHELTEIIWKPVENSLAQIGPVEKIIIVPDGPLNYIPFESLGKEFLLNAYTIQYHYSAALWASAEPAHQNPKPSLIAMAPIFEDKKTNQVNEADTRFVKSSFVVDSVNRAFSLDGQYIAPLPATKIEVESITKINLENGIVSKYFLLENANEERIKRGELLGYDYVHMATHGFVNTQYPELSGLLLSQNASSAEDGILYSGEIMGLNFKADLITLSACETALGKKVEGEGVRGLTTAFLLAGARNVIASLWKVADESTAQLMITFYDELHSGKDKATALQLSKKRLMTDERYSHPYFWAPFIQIGAN